MAKTRRRAPMVFGVVLAFSGCDHSDRTCMAAAGCSDGPASDLALPVDALALPDLTTDTSDLADAGSPRWTTQQTTRFPACLWGASPDSVYINWLAPTNLDVSEAWHSTDHGATWKKQPFPEQQFVCNKIWGLNPGKVFMVGSGVHGAELWTTTDDGVTWHEVISVSINGKQEDAIDIAGQSSELLIGVDGNVARVLRSRDGGLTWTPTPTPPPNVQGTFTSVYETPGGRIFVGSGGNSLQFTDDGGLTWAPHAAFLDASWRATVTGGAANRVFVQLDKGGATTRIFRSDDGGSTFQEKTPAFSDLYFDGLWNLDDRSLWFVHGGDPVSVYYSADGLDHWTQIGPHARDQATATVESLWASSPTDLYVVTGQNPINLQKPVGFIHHYH
jgi:photosystem II stability/assembly factor-like uncharacterized protein